MYVPAETRTILSASNTANCWLKRPKPAVETWNPVVSNEYIYIYPSGHVTDRPSYMTLETEARYTRVRKSVCLRERAVNI